jgi:hypothetical protein
MKNWQPVDIIILIITIVVGFTISFSVMGYLFSNKIVPSESAELVAGVIGSLISIISIYVGSKLRIEKSTNQKTDNKG